MKTSFTTYEVILKIETTDNVEDNSRYFDSNSFDLVKRWPYPWLNAMHSFLSFALLEPSTHEPEWRLLHN